jgi:hypothetical protein
MYTLTIDKYLIQVLQRSALPSADALLLQLCLQASCRRWCAIYIVEIQMTLSSALPSAAATLLPLLLCLQVAQPRPSRLSAGYGVPHDD